MNRIRRIAGVLAGLACACKGPATAAPLSPRSRSWASPGADQDFHQGPKLPAEAIAQIADDTRHARADRFGVRQIELPQPGRPGLLPARRARRGSHPPPPRGTGVPRGDVHQVDSLA